MTQYGLLINNQTLAVLNGLGLVLVIGYVLAYVVATRSKVID